MTIEFELNWEPVGEDDPFRIAVCAWAARVLDVPLETIQRIETEWTGLCNTCEYSEGEIKITLTDGRKFTGCETFGLWLRDIVDLDLNEDGTLTRYAHGRELFDLEPVG